jgi:acetoin utilization deacetylase AcuC-like enzyme
MAHLAAVWSPTYEVDIGPHVFPTSKYRRAKDRLVEEGTLREQDVIRPEPVSWETVARVHSADYVRKVREGSFTEQEEWLLEVPFSPELRRAALVCCGGSLLAGRTALERGICVHLGGGFHHAFPDHGEGFCLLNDVAVALRELLARGAIRRAAVLDCDVHHGNGTAVVFRDDDRVFTLSVHQEANYPAHKPPGDLDLGLEDGVDDEAYLSVLRDGAAEALERSDPDLAFYLAGADPYREDQLGGLALTRSGLRARDELVFRRCRDAGVPVAVCLAGGYAIRLDDTVEIHCSTARVARASGLARLVDEGP